MFARRVKKTVGKKVSESTSGEQRVCLYACTRDRHFSFDAGMHHTEQAAPSAEGERVEGHGSPGHGRSGASLARGRRELRGFRLPHSGGSRPQSAREGKRRRVEIRCRHAGGGCRAKASLAAAARTLHLRLLCRQSSSCGSVADLRWLRLLVLSSEPDLGLCRVL
jgi:hypothetical protein